MDKDYEQILCIPQKSYARVSGLSPRVVNKTVRPEEFTDRYEGLLRY